MRIPLLLGLMLVGGADAFAQPCDVSPLVIRNVNVWTPNGPVPRRDVFLQGGKVASIEPSGGEVAEGAAGN